MISPNTTMSKCKINKESAFLVAVLVVALCSCAIRMQPLREYPKDLAIVQRNDWGWKALPRTVDTHEISTITIHHRGTDFLPGTDVVQYLQNLQVWSRSEKGWIDIPYHFMMDLEGRIYEARPLKYPGDTNTDYDPRGHALICLMGNYEKIEVQPVQLESLVQLCAYLAESYDIDPAGIRGHKDYTDGTLCPGKNLYPYIQSGELQAKVGQYLKNNEYQ